jgi:hypothetical protein
MSQTTKTKEAKNSKQLTPEMKKYVETLTPKERKYFYVMWAKYGVLFITSKPGVAKSAIGRSIADKMGFKYLDMRLSMNDESDFKFPYLTDVEYNGQTVKLSGFAIPQWAYDANQQPTLIHFEELNRAPLFVRNAALQILLEREIGDFKFNENVIMMASGNLGDEDGTDVEELDAALNNRLVHISHSLSVDEWLEGFAEENCHKMIVSYIKAHPEKMYVKPTDQGPKAYASPRSWTMLSEFIVRNFGMDASPKEFLPMLREVASGYLGNTALKFLQYCEDMLNVSIMDVLNNYKAVKGDLEKYNRDKKSELLNELKEHEISNMTSKQLDNLEKFLRTVGEDERTAYLLWVLDENDNFSSGKLRDFIQRFKETFELIRSKSEN